MNDRVLCLLSGGIDSAVLLRREQHYGMQAEALFFNIGQTAYPWERAAAQRVATGAGVKMMEVSLADWKDKFPRKVEMLVVPRNLIFVMLAVPFARALSCDWIALGSTADDTDVADSNLGAVQALDKLLEQIEQPMRVRTPWLCYDPRDADVIGPDDGKGWTKAAIVRWSDRHLGCPFVEQTRSCYGKNEQPCGTCRACQNRNNAIREARKE